MSPDAVELKALVAEAVREYFHTVPDLDELRRSPAGAIIRLEEKVNRIESTMATKENVAIVEGKIAALAKRIEGLAGRFAILLTLQIALFGMVGAILVKIFFR